MPTSDHRLEHLRCSTPCTAGPLAEQDHTVESHLSRSPSGPDLRRQDKIGARPQVPELNLQETNNSHSGRPKEEEMNPDSSIPLLRLNHHQKLSSFLSWLQVMPERGTGQLERVVSHLYLASWGAIYVVHSQYLMFTHINIWCSGRT